MSGEGCWREAASLSLSRTKSFRQPADAKFPLTNRIRVAISCGRKAAHTRNWVAIENLGRKKSFNGGKQFMATKKKAAKKKKH
jgi:hypothetical protein